MTTDKIILKRLGDGGSVLDLPMAALAALSVAFVAYAMPDALFADAVAASGLPSLLPAAQPPLGTTARLAVVAPAAIVAFLLTWTMLRALGSRSAPVRREPAADEAGMPPLRLRRADTHPDAPLRRPLVAGLELGEPEPAEDIPVSDEAFHGEWVDPPHGEETDDEVDAAAALPPMDLEQPTIAHLMQRLERGLSRRREPGGVPVAEAGEPISAPVIDGRLQGALDDLRRMARGV